MPKSAEVQGWLDEWQRVEEEALSSIRKAREFLDQLDNAEEDEAE